MFGQFYRKIKGRIYTSHELDMRTQQAPRQTFLSKMRVALGNTSTFSELLLYDNISDKISDDEKKIMLSEKIDDLYVQF